MDGRGSWWVVALSLWCWHAGASTIATDVIRVDLNPLIDQAVRSETQFAVNVRHGVDSESAGQWSSEGDKAVWTYSARIPTAITIAFHGSKMKLPANALLTMTASGINYTIKPGDIHLEQLWSRIGRGDTLTLRLIVEQRDRSKSLIAIDSFQAGFRALVPGMKDHPHYQKLKSSTAAAALTATACTENYQCHLTAGNQGPGKATMALVISNTYACTGTLVNDAAQDGLPYVITARHCQNGQPGGGDPGAASSVVAYWDALSSCGTALDSIFSTTATLSFYATTLVEQQDFWLIRLLQVPPSDAYYAGWDAQSGPVIGGYTIHHANADAKQYTQWSGQAYSKVISAASLGVGYSGTFLEVVNSLGNIDHGSSGSALFNTNHQLVGTLSRGRNDCPVVPTPVPSDTSATAYVNSLAAVWKSTSDKTSSTGTNTLASVLDAGNTGMLSVGGGTVPFTVTLVASSMSSQVALPITLNWYSAAQSCSASGGSGNDGWSGAKPASGSMTISESQPGAVTYTLTCSNATRSVKAVTSVLWTTGPPSISLLLDDPGPLFVKQLITLRWSSNLNSCAATGGAAGDGWAASSLPSAGARQVTEPVEGTFQFTVTCTDGAQTVSTDLLLGFQVPISIVSLFGPSTPLRVGQEITVLWNGSPPCRATGGAAGDGWAGDLYGGNGIVSLTEHTAGTFAYGLSCGPGAAAVNSSLQQVYTSDAPTAQLTANPTQQQTIVGFPQNNYNLSWIANVKPCSIDYAGPVSGSLVSNWVPIGSAIDIQQIAGLYTYTLTCGTGSETAVSTATINWTQPPPQVTLSAPSAIDVIAGQGTYLRWSTNVLPCVGSGGTPGDGWNGPLSYSYWGNVTPIKESLAGAYQYTLTCGVGPFGTASAAIVYNNPGGTTLTLAASNSAPYVGQPVTLSWDSKIGPCTAFGGLEPDGWAGSKAKSGSATVSEPEGTYEYDLKCGTGPQTVQVNTVVTFTAPPATLIWLQWNGGGGSPGDVATLSWTGVQGESCEASGGGPGDGWAGPRDPSGSYSFTESQPGSFVYTMTCTFLDKSQSQSVRLDWYPPPPKVTLTVDPAQTLVGKPAHLTWSATDATACYTQEGGPGDGWAKSSVPLSGEATLTEANPGTYGYLITCSNGTGVLPNPVTASAEVYFAAAPAVVISVDRSSVTAGDRVQVSWSSINAASCVASGGNGSDGWSGSLDLAGNRVMTESKPGSFTFTVQCAGSGATASANASVSVAQAASSGGGGGGIDWRMLPALGLLLWGTRLSQAARHRNGGTQR